MEKLSSDVDLTHMVAFHAKPCIEKSLNAVIEEYELGSVRIHHLERLFEIIEAHISMDPDPVLTAMLDKLYIDARYPGDLGLLPDGKPTVRHAAKFEAFARSVYQTIKQELEKAGA